MKSEEWKVKSEELYKLGQSDMMGTRVTRIGRIDADFALPAAKFFWPRIAQIFTNLGTNFVCAKAP